jgi:hypothetical protein
VKKHRPFLWIAALGATAFSFSSLPAHAGVTIDRGSPSLGCGAPVNPATIFSQMPPAAGCPVAEVLAGALGLGAADNVDGVSANTLWAATTDFVWIFSGDRAAMGQAASNYQGEAAVNQAASDLWRTLARPTASPAAVVAAACGAPAAIAPPFPTQMRLQTDFRLIPFLGSGVAFGGVQDNIDDFDMDDLDPSGNLVHDIGVYFSLDPASPALGGGSGADLFFAAPGAAFVPFSAAANIGLNPADDIDALVMWDRGALGVMNPLVDVAVFSLAPGSPALLGPDGVGGTADDLSPGDLLVTSFNGFFCIYLRPNQLGMLNGDNIDGLDVTLW